MVTPPAISRNDRFYDNDSIKDPDKDPREPSKHDRDRILHSSALRRLAEVTQVVDPAEGHVFHNRLTHTLKVAQIARRLGEKLLREDAELVEQLGGIDPEVVESAALAHDLGHPPFGHIAETELDNLVSAEGLPDGYEGNAQSFRIITKLEVRDTEQPGLNLTRATLNAVLKYPRFRRTGGTASTKWGAYLTEEAEFKWARQLSIHSRERCLEAELMDWADDIAFSTHDVEDFYRAGLIPLHTLLSNAAANKRLKELSVEALFTIDPSFIEDVLKDWRGSGTSGKETSLDKDQLLDILNGFYWMWPFSVPYNNTRQDKAWLRLGSSILIARYINGLKLNREAIGNPNIPKVTIDEDYRREIRVLKQFTWHYVIHNRALATQQYGKRRLIRELFGIFMDALNSTDPEAKYILPDNYEEQIESIEKHVSHSSKTVRHRQAKARLAADVISSLTDHEALAVHRRLTGINPGSILDKLPH